MHSFGKTSFSNLTLTIIYFLILGLCSGCGAVYTNVRVPRSYRAATVGDVGANATEKVASGEACNTTLLFLFAWGNGGYAGAVQNALKNEPNALLYDVTADSKLKSILGIYARYCTVVTGKIARIHAP